MAKEVQSHAMFVGNFTPYTKGHHANVGEMLAGGHDSVNVFATKAERGVKPIAPEKKVDYIKTAVGDKVNVDNTTNPFHAASQVYSSGKRGKLVLYGGSDREPIADRLREYNGKEGKHGYYKFHSIDFKKVGEERKEGAEGLAGVSGTAARKSKTVGELKKFLPTELHSRAKEILADLKESVGIFLLGGPGSGKDYVLKNIFSRFDLMEVQIDQVISGSAAKLFEQGTNVVINGGDVEKIQIVKSMLENYTFDHIFVSVTNRVSRERNNGLKQPLSESKRIDKFLKAQRVTDFFEDIFVFNNSINLNESNEIEKLFFANQIEKLLERVIDLGLEMKELAEPKAYTTIKEQNKPLTPEQKQKKFREYEKQRRVRDKQEIHHSNAHLHAAAVGIHEDGLKDACWKGYEAIGTKKKNGKTVPNCVPVKEAADKPLPLKLKHLPRSGNITAVKQVQVQNKKAAQDVGAVQENLDINALFEMQLVGTDEYRQHAIAMTPGQNQEIEDVTANLDQNKIDGGCSCGGNCGEECSCGGTCSGQSNSEDCGCGNAQSVRGFRELRNQVSEATKKVKEDGVEVDTKPVLTTKRAKNLLRAVGKGYDSTMSGVPVTSTGTGYYSTGGMVTVEEQADAHAIYHEFCKFCCDHHGLEEAPTLHLHDDPEWTTQNGTFGHYTPSTNTINLSITGRHPMDIMRTLAHEITHAYQNSQSPLPPEAGETGSDWENHANAEAGVIMRKWRDAKPEAFKAMMESAGLEESIQYHLENNISFTENVFRPGSDNFFAMISEAKRLYAEGKYKPADEYEQDLLESNIGDRAFYEGKEVILDFPFQEILNEEDETGGHGIGKPFRSHGGGAVYVKNSKGNVIKVNFSQSGMKKRINEPARVRSFVARHHCLTNKDRTSASYWACRWPRYFSDTGQQWW